MLCEVSVDSGVTHARLRGDLDLVNVDALRELLDELCGGTSRKIVLDICDVSFVDVMSMSVILGMADALRESDRELAVEGASASVRRLFATLNAEDVLVPGIQLDRHKAPPAC